MDAYIEGIAFAVINSMIKVYKRVQDTPYKEHLTNFERARDIVWKMLHLS